MIDMMCIWINEGLSRNQNSCQMVQIRRFLIKGLLVEVWAGLGNFCEDSEALEGWQNRESGPILRWWGQGEGVVTKP